MKPGQPLGRTTLGQDVERLKPVMPGRQQSAFRQLSIARKSVRAVYEKTGMADNVATALFTVTTANETGSNDGGVYSVWVTGVAGHPGGYAGSPNSARAFRAHWTRAQQSDGTGVNSSVTEEYDDALADTGATRSIDGIALTVTETSEYVNTVNLAVNVSGAAATTARITLEVLLVWSGFLTPPVLAAV